MADDHQAHKQRLLEAKQKATQQKTGKSAQSATELHSFFEITEEEERVMSSNGGKELWTHFLEKVETEKGQVMLASLMGSKRYNLHVETSDLDLVVVCLPNLEDIIGMRAPLQTFKQFDNLRPDFSVHSLEHYCNLLTDGDAKSLELLFAHSSMEYQVDDDWKQLCAWKSRFLTKRVISNYIGELKGLKGIRKLEKLIEDRDSETSINKCAYILMRLILLPNRFITGFQAATLNSLSPTWFDDTSDDYKLLMSIRNGDMDAKKLLKMISSGLNELETTLAACSLPIQVSPKYLDEMECWYLNLRQKHSLYSFEPTLEQKNLKVEISGNIHCIYRSEGADSYFGVYSQNLPDKLSLFSDRTPNMIINKSIASQFGSSTDNDKKPSEHRYSFYELDRFVEALNRTELATIVQVHQSQRLVYCSSTWSKLLELLPSMWTHTLLYQSCGFLSGRFKCSRGKVDLLSSKESGFADPVILERAQFAIKLLSFALSDESPRPVLDQTSREALQRFLLALQKIESVCAALCSGIANSTHTDTLKQLSQSYSKDFIALRPIISNLLLPEMETDKLAPFFLSCRLESYGLRTK
jgi:hypothetical protein